MTKKNSSNQVEIIDAFEGFRNLFNSDEDAIDFIVSHTYFIDPELVRKQKDEMKEPYYVRFSEKKKYYTDMALQNECSVKKNKNLYEYSTRNEKGKRVPNDGKPLYISDENEKTRRIIVDRDNNKKVREEINKYTKRKVSWGKDSNNMTNFVITHIWGKAYEPDYFSFMWNYYITPSFAASLTDKENPDFDNNSFEYKLQSTLKAIALALYWDYIPEKVKNEDSNANHCKKSIKTNLLCKDGKIVKDKEVIRDCRLILLV